MKELDVKNLKLAVKSRNQLIPVAGDLSFSLERGEKLGIVGESGSGKTQTVLSLIGLTHPNIIATAGKITFRGEVLMSAGAADKREQKKRLASARGDGIGIIFQDARASLLPFRTIEQQGLETWLALKPYSNEIQFRSKVKYLLQRLGFNDPEAVLKKYPVQLSGGQAQRAYIMLALLGQPSVLIADEPTSSLDPYTSKQIIGLIKEICDEQHISLIIISHDLSEIMSIADRIIVMYAGRIVEEFQTQKLREGGEPRHPYARFLFSMATGELFAGLRQAELNSSAFQEDYLNGAKYKTAGCPYASQCPLKKKLSPEIQLKCETLLPDLRPSDAQSKSACWGIGDEKQ